ncbi:MAG: substrate-binding domain-containing protein [Acidobacteria bacterium]|nr:substrate-binding domain-containing protein [Acidobacteriota bacterium]
MIQEMILRRHLLGAGAAGLLAACNRRGKVRIGVIPKATSHLFFLTVRQGVDRAAAELGVEVLWNGPHDETDHSRQIQILDSMLAQRVDAIAISATDERALAAPVERAIKTGIPVTIFDSGVNVQDYVSFIATDNHSAGQAAAHLLAGLVAGPGEVAMIMQKPGGTSTGLREQGFAETLATDHTAVRLVARQYGMADAARARAAAENILTAHPRLSGMFASSEAASLGAIQAIKARGLSGKLRLVTFDTSESHVAALRDGTIDRMMVQDAAKLGYEAVRSLVRKLRGETPERLVNVPVQQIARGDLETPAVRQLLAIPG